MEKKHAQRKRISQSCPRLLMEMRTPCTPTVNLGPKICSEPKNQTTGTASGPGGRNFGATHEPIRCHPSSESAALLQEVHEDQINGCSEEVEEWEELDLLVDSGASATVVGKDEVRAGRASTRIPTSSTRWLTAA